MGNLYNKNLFGTRLKQLRKVKKLSQEDLQVADRRTVSNWEKGICFPNIDVIIELCNILECDIDYLLGKIDCLRKEVAEVREITGLYENSILSLQELSTMSDKIKELVLSFIDDMLDFPMLPYFAIKYHEYLNTEHKSGSYSIIEDSSGKVVGMLPDDVDLILLQNAFKDFLSFAKDRQNKKVDELSSKEMMRNYYKGLSNEAREELIAQAIIDLERGK